MVDGRAVQGTCKKLGAYPKIAPFKAGQSYDPDALHGKAPEWVEFREGTTHQPQPIDFSA